ncbi:MAG: hypothetical protein K940chlam3_01447 [Chlamydiae bacterium]|nr:hypothetical protein [Chlamydiota bacterium]
MDPCSNKITVYSSNETTDYPSTDLKFKSFVYSKSPKEQARLLENAAKAGDIETIQKLFELNVNPDVKSGDYPGGALYVACIHNQVEVAETLIDHGARSAYTLKLMIMESRSDCVKLLLELKADPNKLFKWDGKELRPLYVACIHNQVEVAKTLLDHGAKSAYSLKLMISESRLDCVKLLLKLKADPNELSHWEGNKQRPLHILAGRNGWPTCMSLSGNERNIICLLIEHKANVLLKNSRKNTPLDVAVYSKNSDALGVLLPHYKKARGNVFYTSKQRKSMIRSKANMRRTFRNFKVKVVVDR